MTNKKPDFIREFDGGVEITLASPAKVNGQNVTTLRMREPAVRDVENVESYGTTPAAQEIAMFANLCEITPDDVRGMSLRNHKRLQEGFKLFTD